MGDRFGEKVMVSTMGGCDFVFTAECHRRTNRHGLLSDATMDWSMNNPFDVSFQQFLLKLANQFQAEITPH
jgi:hypothetical protein